MFTRFCVLAIAALGLAGCASYQEYPGYPTYYYYGGGFVGAAFFEDDFDNFDFDNFDCHGHVHDNDRFFCHEHEDEHHQEVVCDRGGGFCFSRRGFEEQSTKDVFGADPRRDMMLRQRDNERRQSDATASQRNRPMMEEQRFSANNRPTSPAVEARPSQPMFWPTAPAAPAHAARGHR